jgi:hypothetical protein
VSRAWRLNNIGRCYTDKLCGVNNVRAFGIASRSPSIILRKFGIRQKPGQYPQSGFTRSASEQLPRCLSAPSASLPRHLLVHSPSAPLSLQRVRASMHPLHLHAPCQLLGQPSLYLRVASAKVPVRIKFLRIRMLLFFFLRFSNKLCPCMCSRWCPVRENCRGVGVREGCRN